jgi:ferrous iron transport protein B
MTEVALAGQPNVGKSSVFNSLTKLRQHVGNWPGKTVEKKEGDFELPSGRKVRIIDLPGIYSLTSHTLEEIVTRDFILQNKPDAIINVVDASNLERNLYLTTELLELGRPIIIVLNMMDLAKKKGYRIDLETLSGALGVPVVSMAITQKTDLAEFHNSIDHLIDKKKAANKSGRASAFRFSEPVEKTIRQLTEILTRYKFDGYPIRWLAIKLLEDDEQARNMIAATIEKSDMAIIEAAIDELPHRMNHLAEDRYEWIKNILDSAIRTTKGAGELSYSDRIDLVLTNRWLGVPILTTILMATFFLVFKISPPLQELIGGIFVWLSNLIESQFEPMLPTWLVHLFSQGILTGVGTAASFVPLIFIAFAAFGLLEDVGYFARAAFLMDRLLGPLGIPGRSFISLLMGYWCNVPAIMATRTAESTKERLLAIMVIPLTICSARQIVAIALVGAFFQPIVAPWILLALYVISFVLVSLASLVAKSTVLQTERNPFFIELPAYRWPNWSNIASYALNKTKNFLRQAATFIAATSAIIWILMNFPSGSLEHSILGTVGRWIEPIGAPLGFDWRLMIALLSGIAAKETTLATLGVLYGANDANIGAVLASHIPFATGMSFLVFSMFYVPCLATTFTIKNETGSWKWTLFSALYTLLLALALSFGAYRLALFFG